MIGSNLLNLATNVIWLEPRDRRSECLSVALEVQARQPGLNVLVLLAFMSDFPSETFSNCFTDALHFGIGMTMETNRTSRFSRLRCPRMHWIVTVFYRLYVTAFGMKQSYDSIFLITNNFHTVEEIFLMAVNYAVQPKETNRSLFNLYI